MARQPVAVMLASERTGGIAPEAPFDTTKLDQLLEQHGFDVALLTSGHNVRYMLGGYQNFNFGTMTAIGVSRYLPIVIYWRGRPEDTTLIARGDEKVVIAGHEKEHGPLWMPKIITGSYTTEDAVRLASEELRRHGLSNERVGIEMAFMPYGAGKLFAEAFPQAEFSDVNRPMERLRARKSRRELTLLREASERLADAIVATFEKTGPGSTKFEIIDTLRREQTERGLTYQYSLITVGDSRNRVPSRETWDAGAIMSIDSASQYNGYLADLCRMGILGEPDPELKDMLAEVARIQDVARAPIRNGVRAGQIYADVEAAMAASPLSEHLNFIGHGMGLVSHESPRLTDQGPVPYPASDVDLPLETGTVLSLETILIHPRRGFIKLEDTVAVTDDGVEGFGDAGRGWNRGRS